MKVHGLTVAAALLLLSPVVAVKSSDFKTCSESGFCRRGRALASRARENSASWSSPYSIVPDSITLDPRESSFTAAVRSSLYPDIKFGLDVRIQEDGVVRVRMDEVDGLRKRYDETARWALVEEPVVSQGVQWAVGESVVSAKYGADVEVILEFQPLRVVLRRGGFEQVVINGRGLLHMEHFRLKEASIDEPVPEGEGEGEQIVLKTNPVAWFEGEDQDAFWEETWSKWTDSKPKGMFCIA